MAASSVVASARRPVARGWPRSGSTRCQRDLEDELIRALGVERMLAVVEGHGELDSFRVLQQPAGPARAAHRGQQLHRFLGAGSGRKVRYGRLLVEALDEDEVPAPLTAVLADALA